MKKIHFVFQGIKLPLDFLLIIIGGILAYFLRFVPFFTQIKPILFNLTFQQWLVYIIFIALISVFILAINGVYSLRSRNNFIIEIFRLLFSLFAAFLIFLLYGFIVRIFFESRFIFFAALIFSFLLLLLERMILYWLEKFMYHKSGAILNQVIIIGTDDNSSRLKKYFQEHPSYGYKIIKTLKTIDLKKINSIIAHNKVDDIIFTSSNDINKFVITELSNLCQEKAINLKYVPTLFEISLVGTQFEEIEGVPVLELKKTSLDGWGKVYKRIFDLVTATVLLVISFPLLLIIAIIIKIDSPGPIFARIPHRVGFKGEPFYMYKFRTMIKNADKLKKKLLPLNERKDGGPLFKLTNDPRVTRFGKLLRKTRLDELPQLINVIKGEMSLVGPRPHEIQEVEQYKPHHKRVLGIKPGITGLAQISGSHNLPFETENKLDLYYIENWSPLLDLKILAKTLIFLFKDRSAV